MLVYIQTIKTGLLYTADVFLSKMFCIYYLARQLFQELPVL